MASAIGEPARPGWRASACISCECNCGVEILLGEDGRSFSKIRGDKRHPASRGYTCNKALQLDAYQNGRGGRVTRPLRRRADSGFEEIDWDTAISEVAARLGAVRDSRGGEKIFYYGGGRGPRGRRRAQRADRGRRPRPMGRNTLAQARPGQDRGHVKRTEFASWPCSTDRTMGRAA
jgi:anaerobic selenocysteine-containing dehydrogenase